MTTPPDNGPQPGTPEFEAMLEWRTGEDETHVARTDDGWNIGLYRYRPRRPGPNVPVLTGHGFAGTHLIYDVSEETSLARALAGAGFDVWCVDVRGRNASWPDAGANDELQWTFDDFVFRDLPAAFARVLELTEAPHAFWVGMEMSGIAAYAMSISGTAPMRAAITLGSPARTPRDAQVPAVTTGIPERTGTRYRFDIAREHGPALARTAPEVLQSSFRAENTDWWVAARYLRHGVPDESSALVDQFSDWIDNDTMRAADRSIDWAARLSENRVPMLLLAASHDLQRPSEAVEATARELGGEVEFRRVGRSTGFSTDYGHDDLVAGRATGREVFPILRDWLEAHA